MPQFCSSWFKCIKMFVFLKVSLHFSDYIIGPIKDIYFAHKSFLGIIKMLEYV